MKAKLIPKEIRRLSKINKIVKENDALKIIKKEGLEAAAVVYDVSVPKLKKLMIRAQKRLEKERELDDSV